ncbi:hypothetical protein KS4_16030 [Poriferisphaera corsica]|uniref:Uncharacterized protein n=1 Tax=Poriferisphaera corsica TaxID=2528020 RepID=A0A517YTP5_9BACT|nr:tudor domain-containing protein [Poriferisphaera corsica]QDU33552.1 hypothetical protein KS4_16030 [Poriferisphaera corsica]
MLEQHPEYVDGRPLEQGFHFIEMPKGAFPGDIAYAPHETCNITSQTVWRRSIIEKIDDAELYTVRFRDGSTARRWRDELRMILWREEKLQPSKRGANTKSLIKG